MISNKVLFFTPYKLNPQAGGPPGFLAQNLLDKPRDYFVLLEDIARKGLMTKFKSIYFNKIYAKVNLSPRTRFHAYQQQFYINQCSRYKYIFFHEVFSLGSCLSLINRNQTVILQSHSPELPSEELAKDGANRELVELVAKLEQQAFSRANLIVLPNKNVTPIYDALISDKGKVRYILSGCAKPKDVRNYPLQTETVNFLFIGRRNEVKGYDILMEAFRQARSKRADIRLLLVGKGELCQEPGVIDIGFSSTPLNWINSVDYVVNTNRRSYFDLSVMETISIGVPIILSNTDGHKYYQGKSDWIKLFDTKEQLVQLFMSSGKTKKNENIANDIKTVYNTELTDERYYERLTHFFKALK